jgi:cytidylate kinase
LWHIQCNAILQLADNGPCVIVGRNADYILKDRKDAFHAYIHADMEHRADRIVRLYGESEKKPETRLNEKDKRRALNYQHYTGRTWGDAKNYDICINTGKIDIEKAANLIVSLVRESE